MKTLGSAISAVVGGNINKLPEILEASHSDLVAATYELTPLVITRDAIVAVLTAWRDQSCTSDDAQKWASFVRRGFVAGRSGKPVRSIDIKYDAIDEDLIVEIIARLDEIGDLVDGYIDDDEVEEMLRVLKP
ncbi:MAG: hypothetical protein WAT25_13295 [Paracoccaceae bacterium]